MLKLDAAPDAAQEGSLFVVAEVVPGVVMEDGADFAKAGGNLGVQPIILRFDT